MTTKNDLLATAKSLNIVGRHEMTKDELENAVNSAQAEQFEREAAESLKIDKNLTIETKRRYPSLLPRDAAGKVIRKERNLSGNRPYQQKFYFFNDAARQHASWEEAFKAAPKQVQNIIQSMIDDEIFDEETAQRGVDIAGDAINNGKVKSVIPPANLFAYYRRVMETLGLTQATGE